MNDNQTFTVLPEHIALLRVAYVSWEHCEYGAPAIDCKRPYGNSDVPNDIREVLGYPTCSEDHCDNCEPTLSDEECRKLHEGTETALQIILATGSFEPGDYVADKYRANWRPA